MPGKLSISGAAHVSLPSLTSIFVVPSAGPAIALASLPLPCPVASLHPHPVRPFFAHIARFLALHPSSATTTRCPKGRERRPEAKAWPFFDSRQENTPQRSIRNRVSSLPEMKTRPRRNSIKTASARSAWSVFGGYRLSEIGSRLTLSEALIENAMEKQYKIDCPVCQGAPG